MKLPGGTSGVRAALLVAAVLVGLLVLGAAFATNPSRHVIGEVGDVTAHPSPRARPPETEPPRPSVHGVVVQVFNGTGTLGLANLATEKLKKAGYTTRIPDNADQDVEATIVYYRAESRVDAEYLQSKYFPGGSLRVASLPAGLDIRVVVGEDFASTVSPSP